MSHSITTELRDEGFEDVRSFAEIRRRFLEFARLIMCSYELVYGENERRWHITALELYLCTCRGSNVRRDPYTHSNPEQLKSGTWYVHDDGNRAPFFSGIDITCGSEGTYGGMLIKELSCDFAYVVQRMVRGDQHVVRTRKGNVWNCREKKIIRAIHGKSIDCGLLRLERVPERNDPLYVGPRIGLKKKSNPDGNPACRSLPFITDANDTDLCNSEHISFRTACLRIATWQTKKLKTAMKLAETA